jgi:hypothetical protein
MIGCLNCNKEINPQTGRRPKKFCSDKCRAAYNAKNRNKEPKWVQRETFEKLMEENKRLKEQIQASAKPSEPAPIPQEKQKTKLPQAKETHKPLDTGETSSYLDSLTPLQRKKLGL